MYIVDNCSSNNVTVQIVHIIISLRDRENELKSFLENLTSQLLRNDPFFVLHIAYSDEKPSDQLSQQSYEENPTDSYETQENSGSRTPSSMKLVVEEMLINSNNLYWTWQVIVKSCNNWCFVFIFKMFSPYLVLEEISQTNSECHIFYHIFGLYYGI